MERIVRAIPVKSKEDLIQLVKDIEEYPTSEKRKLLSIFGPSVCEQWYYQDIEGKPYLLAVIDGENLARAFGTYPKLRDPYFDWFRERVIELSGVDLAKVPTAATSEFLYEQTYVE